jgi:tRNA(fMet)-specific endonuclease VapC
MSGYLLDTNVLSELIKQRPSPALLERVRTARREELATSVICVMELRYGTVRHPNGPALWDRILGEVISRVRVLPLEMTAALRAGEVLASLATRGSPIGLEDVLIGATALQHDSVVVTRNLRHFERIAGLRVESWFDP